MLHPSYTDLMKVVNSGVEEGETPVVNSRYSIVLATSKRARQIIAGEQPLVPGGNGKKPLSLAIQELESGQVKIVSEEETETEEEVKELEETAEEAAEAAEEPAAEEEVAENAESEE